KSLPFTTDEDNFLKENYLTIPKNRMATMLAKTETRIRKRIKKLGIVVPLEIIQKFSDDSRFKKGCVAVNKGKKQSDYMSPEAIDSSSKTRFKKGNLPACTL